MRFLELKMRSFLRYVKETRVGTQLKLWFGSIRIGRVNGSINYTQGQIVFINLITA